MTGIDRRLVVAGLMTSTLAACDLPPARDKQAARPPEPQADPQPKPKPEPTLDPGALVELITLDPTIKLDLRYATTNNFTGQILYPQARAFLAGAAAIALLRAHQAAHAEGFGLTIFDAYRPWHITKKLWDATPPAKRNYVANPKQGFSPQSRLCG